MAQSLLELQTKATAKADFHLVTFVQENFLNNHVREMAETCHLVE